MAKLNNEPTTPANPEQSIPAFDAFSDDSKSHLIIDLTRLNAFPDATLEQIILEARVKRSRINLEVNHCHKIIEKVQREMLICLGRIKFYNIITDELSKCLEERRRCRRAKTTTPPAKNSQP